MNQLRPEQRPDKNGKVVTRHVRADKAVASARSNSVAPKVQVATTTHDDEIAFEFNEILEKYRADEVSAGDTWDALSNYYGTTGSVGEAFNAIYDDVSQGDLTVPEALNSLYWNVSYTEEATLPTKR